MGVFVIVLLLLCAPVQAESYETRKVLIDNSQVTVYSGTAFGVSESKLATAWHVVKNATVLQVKVDDQWVEAKVVAKDADADLALLEVKQKVKFAPLAKKLVPHGEKVKFVGYPKAQRKEGEGELVESDHAGQLRALTSNFGPGGSGSPLYYKGEVVGVARATSTTMSNDLYATPVSSLRNLLDQ